MTLSPDAYALLRARIDAFEVWRGGRSGYLASSVPPTLAVSNDERSAVEVYEFVANPPADYFAYVSVARRELTTWTGDKLGDITLGNTWRDNFGGTRQAIRVHAVNGRTYSGTYYKSAGSYARLKVVKA